MALSVIVEEIEDYTNAYSVLVRVLHGQSHIQTLTVSYASNLVNIRAALSQYPAVMDVCLSSSHTAVGEVQLLPS
jgi:hypothetical protein